MNVLTKGLRESSVTHDESKPHPIDQHHINYYIVRRKALADELRHIEKVLLEQGAISRTLCLQARPR